MGSGLHGDPLCQPHQASPQGQPTSSQAALLLTLHLMLVTQDVCLPPLQLKTGLWRREQGRAGSARLHLPTHGLLPGRILWADLSSSSAEMKFLTSMALSPLGAKEVMS